MPAARLVSLQRYPVKGFSPEPLDAVDLEAGRFFPGDRLYAVENGDSGFDPHKPEYKEKTSFLVLMRNARLAALKTHFDHASRVFSLRHAGVELARGDLGSVEGRMQVETALSAYMGKEQRGPLKVLEAPEGHRFTDSLRSGFVSLLNLASVRDLEARMGLAIDPLRFRMNLHVDGWEPGTELELAGQVVEIGPVRLKVLKRTERCAATNVNPDTGERDVNIVKGLHQAYRHTDCGIYAKVLVGGRIAPGDDVRLAA